MSLTHLETIELTSSQSSITFSSIPQDYDDLVVKVTLRSDRSAVSSHWDIRFNSATTNYSGIRMYSTSAGSAASSTSGSGEIHAGYLMGSSATANTFNSASIYVSNYTASQPKSVSVDGVEEDNSTTPYKYIASGLWNDTSAITQMSLIEGLGNNLVAGCTASLYGVTSGGSGTVTTS